MSLRELPIGLQVIDGGHFLRTFLPLFGDELFHVRGILSHRLRHEVPPRLFIGRDFQCGTQLRDPLFHGLRLLTCAAAAAGGFCAAVFCATTTCSAARTAPGGLTSNAAPDSAATVTARIHGK